MNIVHVFLDHFESTWDIAPRREGGVFLDQRVFLGRFVVFVVSIERLVQTHAHLAADARFLGRVVEGQLVEVRVVFWFMRGSFPRRGGEG